MTWWDDLAGQYEEQRTGTTREFITLMLELWYGLQHQSDVSRVATELEKRARLGVFYTFDLAGRAQLRELAGGLKDGDLLTEAAEALALRQGALARERALDVLGRATLAQVSPYARLAASVLVTDALRTGLQGGATLGGATHKKFVRIRPVKEPRSHSVLEGVVKRIDEPFIIGGIPVHGPGAAELPWSEKAWCGHALEYLRLGQASSQPLAAPQRYQIDAAGMERHSTGKYKNDRGDLKSQFFFRIDAPALILQAVAIADEQKLWHNNKAKIKAKDFVGVIAETGIKTQYINLYRRQLRDGTYKVHGSPGSPPEGS